MNSAVIAKTNILNKKLNKLMPVLTPLAVIAGLILGSRISWMKPAVTYLFACMTFLGTMKISIGEIGDTLKKPAFILAFALGSYIVMPIIAELAGIAFFHGDKNLISGYNLLRAIPISISTLGSISAFSASTSAFGCSMFILIVTQSHKLNSYSYIYPTII